LCESKPTGQLIPSKIRYIREGRIIDAMNEFYTDDVKMQEKDAQTAQ
jgi:hypothetical protein